LTWLGVATGIGLLMALLLLFPAAGTALGPLTYGRWMPLHLNLVLYGWLALPLVALLFRAFLPRAGTARGAGLAVQVWSASLIVGAAAWLAGQSSGKAFLDWEGVARAAFLANLLFLAGVLAAGLVRRSQSGAPRARMAGLWGFWSLLLAVPAAMAFATSPKTYPPINPATSGPTGASLLGSTLCVIAILVGTPLLLGLPARAASLRRPALEVCGALAAHSGFFAAVGSGDHSHREPLQIAAVATLLAWAWLLPRWLRCFGWPAESRPWRLAFLAWGGALLATAVPMFLPGLLDRIKFTNALVGHAHLAMAGMATSFAALLLVVLNRETRLAGVLGDRSAFVHWHAGNGLQVAALAAAGALEAVDPGILFRGDPWITVLYGVRAIAGAAMAFAAVRWIRRASRVSRASRFSWRRAA
jgi:cytochrome c oxidase cbb3-type subunit I